MSAKGRLMSSPRVMHFGLIKPADTQEETVREMLDPTVRGAMPTAFFLSGTDKSKVHIQRTGEHPAE
jgi:hypothetical protein